jgi:hypothetical protein
LGVGEPRRREATPEAIAAIEAKHPFSEVDTYAANEAIEARMPNLRVWPCASDLWRMLFLSIARYHIAFKRIFLIP